MPRPMLQIHTVQMTPGQRLDKSGTTHANQLRGTTGRGQTRAATRLVHWCERSMGTFGFQIKAVWVVTHTQKTHEKS